MVLLVYGFGVILMLMMMAATCGYCVNTLKLAKNPAILSGHIGDIANFWVGKLARLYANQSTTVHEAIMLAEWLLTQHDQLFCVLGNHDCLQGGGLENPINWILRHAGSVTEDAGVRIALKSPCGTVTRVNAQA
jgi:hypothetical protein